MKNNNYHDIVVGSGVSGLTLALFLALNGRKVLLLEMNHDIGGSLSRFYKQGIPFDVGFHFTGGLQKGGVLHDMLSLLGLVDLIQPIFLPDENASYFYFESEKKQICHPCGINRIKNTFKDYFPGETLAIDKYFDMVQSVCVRTPALDLKKQNFSPPNLDEDFISLEKVLQQLTSNHLLRAILSGYAMCYGVRPAEISFANHCRICLNLYESIAFVKDGGDAFIRAFKTRFKDLNIEIVCGKYIVDLVDIRDDMVGRFILNTGEEITSDNCIFTIHPKEVLKILPERFLSKAFVNRVSSYESSAGFFALFATCEPEYEEVGSDKSIVSFFPVADVNNLLDPQYKGVPALVFISSNEYIDGERKKIIHMLEPSFFEHICQWVDTKKGVRPEGYIDYKVKKIENIKEHIFRMFPDYKNRINVVDGASMLTFKHYLNSPDGSAYGIKQKNGQYNLIGKLPLHNLYIAGQSALLPGIIGAMMSSLIVGRAIVGGKQYSTFIEKNLCY